LKILVTGASGLLGSAVTRRLAINHTVIPITNSNPLPGTTSINLLENDARKKLDSLDWNTVVHCAAYRNPDYCEVNPEQARKLNTESAGIIASLAESRNARMIHISTDYVFDGNNPPYRETDLTCPANLYGKTKLDAELMVNKNCQDALIMRIPVLYGEPTPPARSPMLEDALKSAVSNDTSEHDNIIVRYPTLTDDVAEVILFFLEKNNAEGIIHVSAPEKATRYEWTLALTRLLGKDCGKIRIMESDPKRIAKRPVNSALNTDKLKSLGAPVPRGYNAVLPNLESVRDILNRR